MTNFFRLLFLAICSFAILPFAQTNPLNMTTMQVVKDMGLGINLGNTFESWPWSAGINWTTVNQVETGWGSPTITEAMIKGYADAGFKTVRIPVAWSNLMTGDALAIGGTNGSYTINTALLNRVAEVADWVLDNGMYAIVNIHWDGGWWSKFPTDSAECMRKYTRVWEQVGAKFKDYNGYLLLASFNEEGVWDDVWNRWSGTTGADKNRAYGLLRAINQQFVTTVRGSGSNNANRHLQVQGYATDIDLTVDQAFLMPTDPRTGGARLAVSVHYYDPFPFTHLDADECYWECHNPANIIHPMMTWGTTQDYTDLNSAMNKLVTRFVNNNIPVIIGEYGFASELDRDRAEVRKYTLAVAEAIYTRNMCPILWDYQKSSTETKYYYDRTTNPPALVDAQLVAGFKAIVPASSSSSSGAVSSSSSAVTVTVSCTLPNNLVTGTTLSTSTLRGYLRCSNTGNAPTTGTPTFTGTPSAPISGNQRTVAAAGSYTNITVTANCGTGATNVQGTCNNITIAAVSSSSSVVASSSSSSVVQSSSSEGSTPILNSQLSTLNSTPTLYYDLKGIPLGTTKPTTPGLYIEKNGKNTKKIVVR